MEAAPVDLSKMKVADLKKELKARGLSVDGKKNELQERLAEALAADGSALGAPAEDGADDEEEEIDAATEEALLAQATPKAGAKRPAPKVDAISPGKKVIKLGQAAAPKTEETPKTDEEKTAQEKRAERFGLGPTDQTKKDARAARFGIVESATKTNNKRAPKLDMTTGSTDIEKLRARAERFGEVSSKTLKKVAVLEKKKERAERFKNGEEVVPETNGKDHVAAEKGEKVAITLGDSKEAEIKKKRAERFAAAK
ncbi:unnamed protein product [Meganyctiphanes norvegica]|uniref:SAP domain-containing protein n=1 Tax=Meganyctiphanes norvegica TaxID=48144 RepID=A0AAV2S2L6_MEGNR